MHFVKGKEYLQVAGDFRIQSYDEDTERPFLIYLSPRVNEKLNFCMIEGWPCMVKYVEECRALAADRRRRNLEDDARRESMERLETGGYTKTRPTHSYSAPAPDPFKTQ